MRRLVRKGCAWGIALGAFGAGYLSGQRGRMAEVKRTADALHAWFESVDHADRFDIFDD